MIQTANTGRAKPKKRQSHFSIFLRRFAKQKVAVLSTIVLMLIILACVLAPVIAPYDYSAIDIRNISKGPSAQHWFGTDDMGRDILSRILYGGRYSIMIGVAATGIALVVGMAIGAVAGFFGGWVDMVVMRACDVLQAVPSMLLSITIAAVLGTGFEKLLIALSVGAMTGYTRLLRASILQIRNVEYIEAATATNCSSLRIILKHVIPNCMTPMIVSATMGMASQILSAAALAYIGLGIQPPNPEWGAMLAGARDYIRTAPHMLIFPGLMIAVTVLCFNMIGDGIRDATDPKMKN